MNNKEYGKDYYTLHYRTEWTDCDNTVISLYVSGSEQQAGIVEVRTYKKGKHRGQALIWNLSVREQHRGKGLGRALLSAAYDVAMLAGCREAVVEWDLRDSPQWVFDWYEREGYDEREFGRGYALMVKPIKENA
ncbi:MAG: GNAT family N-acetyltransferase [Prevotella sp.]|nr:GNAT family N-acetyltransferase [Prevotella sp.]